MRFGIDLDGVLGNFGSRVIETANKMWPGKLPLDYVPIDWNYNDVFTKSDWDAVWAEIKSTPHFWRDEPEYFDNVEDLLEFLSIHQNAEVFFITSRVETVGDSVLVQSSQWLEYRGLWPRKGRSTVIPVADPKFKVAMLQGLKVPFMLDDYAPTVESFQTVENLNGYLLDQPWNRHANNLPRLRSVGEYLSIIESHTK